ncbi:probable transporter Mch2p [Trichomonascus vanleenenianus]|uniref:putative transporter Mch2p n=1 Tax=Trichomonascus vanleenenianus TaxID=2268995 RepID=UPI003ECB4A04
MTIKKREGEMVMTDIQLFEDQVSSENHDEESALGEKKSIIVTTTAPVADEPPNGGWFAWFQVFAGFLALFNSWGIVNAFGAFQSYYKDNLLSNETNSTISWIGSFQGFFVISATIFTGRLLDAGYHRPVLWVGVVLLVFGLMMTSLATEWYQVFLAQGVCAGLGCSCTFVSALSIIAPYFTTKRATALGIMATGSSVGGVVYPIIVQNLIPRVGFPWTTRIIGFMVLVMDLIPAFGLKSRVPPRKSGPFIDVASLTDWPFVAFTAALFFGFIGLYVPIFYIESYAADNGLSSAIVPYMVTILSAGSVFGRLFPNFIADKTGPMNMIIPCTAASAVLAFAWIGIKDSAGVIVFAVLFGFFSGSYVSIPPACIASMTKDMSLIGTRLSMTFFVAGFGLLMGTPVAGALIKMMGGGYLGAQLFGGLAIAIATGFLCLSRMLITKGKIFVKC